MIQQFHFWVNTQRNGSRDSIRYLYTHVHHSIVCNNRKVETTIMSIDR